MPHPSQQFRPRSPCDELALLQSDQPDFLATTEYLHPLITQGLNLFEMSPADYRRLENQLLLDVRIAAARFLGNTANHTAGYRFCTYFSWYIHQRIGEKHPKKTP